MNEFKIEVEKSLPQSDPLYQRVTQEAQTVLDAFEIASFNSRREPYETWLEKNERYIQTPAGVPQSLKGYVTQLEKTAIALVRANREANIRYETTPVVKYLRYRFEKWLTDFKIKRMLRKIK